MSTTSRNVNIRLCNDLGQYNMIELRNIARNNNITLNSRTTKKQLCLALAGIAGNSPDIPEEFLDIVSGDMLVDPIVLTSGHVLDRKSYNMMSTNGTREFRNPYTRSVEPVQASPPPTIYRLKKIIENWKIESGYWKIHDITEEQKGRPALDIDREEYEEDDESSASDSENHSDNDNDEYIAFRDQDNIIHKNGEWRKVHDVDSYAGTIIDLMNISSFSYKIHLAESVVNSAYRYLLPVILEELNRLIRSHPSEMQANALNHVISQYMART